MNRPERLIPCKSGYWQQLEHSMVIILNELSNPPFYSKRARAKRKWKESFKEAKVYAIIYENGLEHIIQYNTGTTRKQIQDIILGCWGLRGYAIAFNKLRGNHAKSQTEELWGDSPEDARIYVEVPMQNGQNFKCCLDDILKETAAKAAKRLQRCEKYFKAHQHKILNQEPHWDEYTVTYQTYVIEKELAQLSFTK